MAGHPFVLGPADGTLPDSALQAWVQQDRIFVVQERRVAALRAHGLPSRLDALLADLDRGLVLEAEAFAGTAAEHGFAPDAEPWPVCLGYTPIFVAPPTTAPWRALPPCTRPSVPTWTPDRGGRAQPGRLGLPRLDPELERQAFRAFVSTGRGLDELAGTPSPS